MLYNHAIIYTKQIALALLSRYPQPKVHALNVSIKIGTQEAAVVLAMPPQVLTLPHAMLRKHSHKTEQLAELMQQQEPRAEEVHASLLIMHNIDTCVSLVVAVLACAKHVTCMGRSCAYVCETIIQTAPRCSLALVRLHTQSHT